MPAGRSMFRLGAASLLLAAALGRSSAAPGGPAQPAEWRTLVGNAYRYKAPPAAHPRVEERPAWLVPGAPAPRDPAIVQLAPIEVRSTPIYGELHQTFANQADEAKRQYVADRLGIGFKGLQSKHAFLGVVTVFHLPVMILGGLSW